MLLAATLLSVPAAAQPKDGFFVAPDGRDSWSGHLPAPNGDGTDGPFATFAAAQAAMHTSVSRHRTYVRGGSYYLDAPLRLGEADAGEDITAYPGEAPSIYGGRIIQDWRRAAPDMVSAKIPFAIAKDAGLPLLIIDGHPLPIAREPPIGLGDDHAAAWFFADSAAAGRDPHRSFRVRAGEVGPVAAAPSGAVVTIFGQRGWQNYVLPPVRVDGPERVVTLDGVTWDALGEGSRFAVLNATPTPGTWRFDPTSGSLMLRLTDPAEALPADGVAATLACIVSIDHAHDLTLSGLRLIGSATEGAGVCLSRSQRITLDRLVVTDTGDGIRLDRSTETRIAGSEISRSGGFGIVLRNGSDGTVVTGNWLHDIGWLHQDASGIWFDGSSHNRFAQNRIESVGKFGIGGGSLTSGGAYDNVIENNEIDHANLRTSDGGGILVINWSQDASHDVIRNNIVSRTKALGNIGWDGKPHVVFQDPATRLVSEAIYLDDWASGVQVSGNLLCNNIGGIELHAGWDNRIYGNVLINGSGIAISVDAENWLGQGRHPHLMQNNIIEHNVVSLDRSSTGQSGIAAVRGGKDAATFDDNLYSGPGLNAYSFHQEPDDVWSAYSFGIDSWRRRGQDRLSTVGADVADIVLSDNAVRVTGPARPPEALLLGDVGRPQDRAGLEKRVRQHCGLL